MIQDNCASYNDPLVFHVPDGVLKDGENILAVRGHDRGAADFLDVSFTTSPSTTTQIGNFFANGPLPCTRPTDSAGITSQSTLDKGNSITLVDSKNTDTSGRYHYSPFFVYSSKQNAGPNVHWIEGTAPDSTSASPPCTTPLSVPRSLAAVNEGDTITLDGSKSTDSGGGNHLLYHWEQLPTGGPIVDLSDPTVATPIFIAPKNLSNSTKLIFKLVVTDNLDVNDKAYTGNHYSTPANVDVTVCASKKDPVLSSDVANVPDTKTGVCDYSQVDVRATYIKGLPLFKHLFIIYTDNDGKQTQFRGGPSGECPDCGNIVSTIEAYDQYRNRFR